MNEVMNEVMNEAAPDFAINCKKQAATLPSLAPATPEDFAIDCKKAGDPMGGKGGYMFIGAHPDDVELNAGGTIANLVAQGHPVTVVVCSHPRGGERGKECRAALKILGVQGVSVHFLDAPDPLPDSSFLYLVHNLEALITHYAPHTVFTHFHADTHQDHETVCKAALAAAKGVPNVYMYNPTYPSGRANTPFHPTLVHAIPEAALALKMQALAQHKSQAAKYGGEAWIKAVEALARADAWRFGGFHGAAELFQVSRTNRL